MHCPVCDQTKTSKDFYNFELSVDGLTRDKRVFTQGCKACVPLDMIKWQIQETKLPNVALNPCFIQAQKQKIAKDIGVDVDQLLPRKRALEIFVVGKKDIIKREKMGLLRVFCIGTDLNAHLKNQKYQNYDKYYLESEVWRVKEMFERGIFIQRTSKTQLKYGTPIPPPDFVFNFKNKQYVYIDKIAKERPCSQCLLVKPLAEFPEIKARVLYTCNECNNLRRKQRYQGLDESDKKKVCAQTRKWAKENKNKVKQYKKSPVEKIKRNLRKRAQEVILNLKGHMNNPCLQPNGKVFDRQIKDVGLNRAQLKTYLESKFQPGMTWENYGPGYMVDNRGKPVLAPNGDIMKIKQWHIDHIRPLASFDLNNPQELMTVNHWTNLQPLWSEDNLKKGSKYDNEN